MRALFSAMARRLAREFLSLTLGPNVVVAKLARRLRGPGKSTWSRRTPGKRSRSFSSNGLVETLELRSLLSADLPMLGPVFADAAEDQASGRFDWRNASQQELAFPETEGPGLKEVVHRREVAPGAGLDLVIKTATARSAAAPSAGGVQVLNTSLLDPNREEGLRIIYHIGPGMAQDPRAAEVLGAYNRAAVYWQSKLSDPIDVHVDIDFTTVDFGNPFVFGRATVFRNEMQYSDVRDRMIADASEEESLVNSLPASGNLQFNLHPSLSVDQFAGSTGNPIMGVARANAKALGFTDLFGPKSVFNASQTIDGSIVFNSGFSFYGIDFNPADGITPNALDFEGAVVHELGHVLGFFSEVDTVSDLVGAVGYPSQFDFGTNTSPVGTDYSQVTPDTVYTPARKFGWTAGVIAARDSDFGDNVARDVNTFQDATFTVDVPNGTYSVSITSGDLGSTAGAERVLVTIEGEVRNAIPAIAPPPAGTQLTQRTRVYNVNVSDGKLTIRMQDADLNNSLHVAIPEINVDLISLARVNPSPLDLFRLESKQGVNFATAPRVLNTGANVPIQVFYDGQFDSTRFSKVDLNGDGVLDAADALGPHEIPMSNGRVFGDGQGAGHWRLDDVTGVTIGIMDPSLLPGQTLTTTAADLRAFDLIGWDLHNSGALAPQVTVTPVVTQDTTPSLRGTVSPKLPNAASESKVFVSIPGALGTNTAMFIADGNSLESRALAVINDGSSQAKISEATLLLQGEGSFLRLILSPVFSTGNGGSFAPFRDFDADPNDVLRTGLTSPQSDTNNDEDVEDLGKLLALKFADFNPGERIHWAIDMDPGNITGSQIVGSTVIVKWDNGLEMRGSPTAAKIIRTSLREPVTTDVTGAFATAITPTGNVQGPVDRVLIRFSEPIQDGSFTLSDVQILENEFNAIVPRAVNRLNEREYEVVFDPQTTVSAHFLRLGPDIRDLAGNLLDQDRNGINGNAVDDRASFTWRIVGAGPDTFAPLVLLQEPIMTGSSLTGFRLYFSESIDPQTLNVSQIKALFGPDGPTRGAIAPTGIVQVSPMVFDVTFADQGQLGEYQLILGTGITDLAGNALSVDGSFLKLEMEHAIQATNHGDGTWTVDGSKLPTLSDGVYDVKATVFDSTDARGRDSTVGELRVDNQAPQASLVAVTPNPRNSSIDNLVLNFNEAVQGVDLADFSLLVDGVPTALSGVSLGSTDSVQWTLSGLSALTSGAGAYRVLLNATASGIADLAGNDLLTASEVTWTTDLAAPTVTLEEVSPELRNTPLATLTFTYSEAVQGFGLEDLQLARDGQGISLAGATLSRVDQLSWQLTGLAVVASVDGSYVLSLTAAGSEIVDLAGNPLVVGGSRTWTLDTQRPVLTIEPVVPSERLTPLESIALTFSEVVQGFTLASLALTRDGLELPMDGTVALTSSDNRTWVLSGLTSLTTPDGAYALRVRADGPMVSDLAGNPLEPGASVSWNMVSGVPRVESIGPVSSPRNTAVPAVQLVFSEAIFGFEATDFVLTREGVPVALPATAEVTLTGTREWSLTGISEVTLADGNYVLTLPDTGTGIVDDQGLPLLRGTSVSWTMDTTAPSVQIQPVDPDLRVTPVNELTFVFTEPVTGFDVGDLRFSLDHTPLSPVGLSLSSGDQKTWVLSGLGPFTEALGTYEVTFVSEGLGIADLAGNSLAGSDSTTWLKAPPLAVQMVSGPSESGGVADTALIVFSRPVTGFSLEDVRLFLSLEDGRPGSVNLLGPTATIRAIDARQWELSGLSNLTEAAGEYTLDVVVDGSGIVDEGGNPLVVVDPLTWSVVSAVRSVGERPVVIQAEDYSQRGVAQGHAWLLAGLETGPLGSGGPTGANGGYLSALTLSGQDSLTTNSRPMGPVLEYQVAFTAPGVYQLDVRMAGASDSSDSLFLSIAGAQPGFANGLPTAGGAAVVQGANPSAGFSWRNGGTWVVEQAGVYTIRVQMRESGVALDALRVRMVTPIVIGEETIET